MSCPSTRRYPRTTLEAWPDRFPYAVERPHPAGGLIAASLQVACVAACVALIVHTVLAWAAA